MEGGRVPRAVPAVGMLRQELQPGSAEPHSTLLGSAWTALELDLGRGAYSQFRKQDGMSRGDFTHEKTFCISEQILFPQNHSRQRLSFLPGLPQPAAN